MAFEAQKTVVVHQLEKPEIELRGSAETASRVVIIMPVHNEADTIESTIRELYDKVATKMERISICAFEDGSTDGTKEVLEKLEDELPNFSAKMTKRKKGYSKAMREAFLSVNSDEFDYVAAIDSDGQYDPEDFFKLWSIMQQDSPDIVMGRRITRREPPYRQLLSKGLQLLESFMFGVKCKDVTSVMRLMKVKTAHEIAEDIKYSKYNFWLEFTARMSFNGYRLVEIPITYRERFGGSKVYTVKNMPKIVISEFRALWSVKKENARKLAISNKTRMQSY